MEQEIWKVSPELPEFEVSSLGHIRYTENKKYVPIQYAAGYKVVSRDYRYEKEQPSKRFPVWHRCYLHRIIMFAFCPDTFTEGAVVNHVNGCKTDNTLANLEWIDAASNIKDKYNPHKKYTQAYIDAIHEMKRQGCSDKHIAEQLDTTKQYVNWLYSTNVHSKDREVIRLLYNNGTYTIKELSHLYQVEEKEIKRLIALKS